MPASGPLAASANRRFTSSAVVSRLQLEHAVGQRGVEHRRAHRVAVQLALQLGVDQRDGGGAAGGRRRQAQHRAARAAQVLVRRVDHQVGVGRVVDGGDLAVADADGLVHHLHHRRQAVGGARRGGDDAVPRRVVEVVVDADHDVQHVAHLHRCGHDHALGAAVEMALQRLGREELAGAFEHQVHAQVAPGNLGRAWRATRSRALRSSMRIACVALGGDVGAPAALHAVELQQVRGGGGAALEFVEVHDLQPVAGARVVRRPLGSAHRRAQCQAADAAHAVDADFHSAYPPDELRRLKVFQECRNLCRMDDGFVTTRPAPAFRLPASIMGHADASRP